ncbi:MAG: Coenzyme F420 hydrogenase/dehydrogenase, beta subunit C-terminal domain [Euryarchaeota archaeon]|nr:Coenzyme F420 hydrogenase/dehydrogenase, beta subunit C-terminal domain [Euryarchaeota archaeon]
MLVPLMKKSLGYEELKKKIIDQNLCSRCGTCSALCNRIDINYDDPILVKDCTIKVGAIQCEIDGMCYENCPKVKTPTDTIEKNFLEGTKSEQVGKFIKIAAARTTRSEIGNISQDGGIVTTILAHALQNKLVDGAIVTGKDGVEPWRPKSYVATSLEQLLPSAGSKYTNSPVVKVLGKAIMEQKLKKMILVGTGCQISGSRNLQLNFFKKFDGIDITTIGLFCYENFVYEKLRTKVKNLFNIDFDKLIKANITKGKFIFATKEGVHEKKVREFMDCVVNACHKCTDFTAELADVSVGSVGSPDRWSTLVIRSKKGAELINEVKKAGLIEVSDQVNLDELNKTASKKKASK